MPLTETQAQMIGVIGIVVQSLRTMGRPDPTDDELVRLLQAAEFDDADIVRDLPAAKALACGSEGERS
jgi:hypothetical protein